MTEQENSDQDFAEEIAVAVYSQYKKLPKKGKPQQKKEWTLLAGIVCKTKTKTENKSGLKVVALGTGSKCLGKSQVGVKGDIVRDSHAEVIARRSFLLYIYNELYKAYNNKGSDIFILSSEASNCRCALRPGVSFHFFTSHTPCGDASIIPKTRTHSPSTRTPNPQHPDHLEEIKCNDGTSQINTEFTNPLATKNGTTVMTSKDNDDDDGVNAVTVYPVDSCSPTKKRKMTESRNSDEDQIGEVCVRTKIAKLQDDLHDSDDTDIYRTGAKCVPGERGDPLAPASGYHTLGVLRTKPGRGERTDSMSCSDKMAKWSLVGCQGALLSMFLTQPLYFNSLVVGRCPYSQNAMKRAINSRVGTSKDKLPAPYCLSPPSLLHTNRFEFECSRSAVTQRMAKCSVQTQDEERGTRESSKIVPSPGAISWHWTDVVQGKTSSNHDVIIQGKRQGIVKTDLDKPKARSIICSMALFKQFQALVKELKPENLPSDLRSCNNLMSLTYDQTKQLATDYQKSWSILLNHCFASWVRKPHAAYQFVGDS